VETTIDTKRCPSCGKIKDSQEFSKNKSRKDGLATFCKSCIKEKYPPIYNKQANRIYKLEQKFGITLEEYNRLFEEQHGCCAICGKHQRELNKSLCVDHNHITNKVRGLLCNECNWGIGKFEVDIFGDELLISTISYLKNSDEL
jgi:hypothetical protein